MIALQTLFKHQALAANFPMLLRWSFHRLLLNQSISFYQDEFAGRISTKVMQTALAVREVWMILGDILVFVVIYFVTMVAVVGGFDAWLLLPFFGWLTLYVAAMFYFVPRLGRVAKAQADARSLMTGGSPTRTPTSPPSSCSRTPTARRVSCAAPCRSS